MSVTALALSGSNLTGSAPFSCCLEHDGSFFAASSPPGQRGDIARLASDLLAAASVVPADIRQLRIDLGPGSYTGLRIAITFARFLQHYGDVTVLACDSLALLANEAPHPIAPHTRLRPLLDARRGKFHCAALVEENGILRHTTEPRASTLDEVLAATEPSDMFVVPPNLDATVMAALQNTGATIHAATDITAERLFAARLALVDSTSAQLEPRYLMGSYAQ